MTTYIRVRLLTGPDKGAHIDVPEEIADREEFERLDEERYPPSNYNRAIKYVTDLNASGEEPDVIDPVPEPVEPKPDEGNSKKKG